MMFPRLPDRWAALVLCAGLAGIQCARSRAPEKPKARTAKGNATPGGSAESTRAGPKPPNRPDPTKDTTEEWRAANSSKYAGPPTTFRKVPVTPRKLSAKALQTNGNGFAIQLPRRATLVTPAVHRGKIFTSGGFHSKEFYAFDARTGKLEWAVNLGDDGPSAPACDDGVCVFNTESCTVFALEADTGRLLWSWWLGDPQMSAPAISKGRVFTAYPARHHHVAVQVKQAPSVGNAASQKIKPPPQAAAGRAVRPKAKRRPPNATHVLAAFELRTGKIIWQRWIDGDVMSAPIAVDKELFVTTFTGTLYKLDQATGRILSAKSARATSAPVVVGKQIYYTRRTDQKGAKTAQEGLFAQGRALAPRQTGRLVLQKQAPYLDQKVQRRSTYASQGKALDAMNGFSAGAPQSANAEKAAANVGQKSVSTLQAFQGSRVLNFDRRNFNTMGDEIICTDSRTGKHLWRQKLKGNLKKMGGFLAAPPAAAGKWLFVATLNGEILQIHPRTGKVSKRYAAGSPVRSQPLVHNGWIYVGTQTGKLVAINTNDTTLTGWAQWGGNAARTGVR